MPSARPVHLRHNGARHHIARSQFLERVIALHEPIAIGVSQVCPFAAHGLRNQKPRRALEVQRRGVKLHELDIGDLRARPVGHRHAVAGSYGGIGGIQEHAPQPAGRQQDRARADRNVAHGLGVVERRAAHSLGQQQIGGGRIAAKRHVGKRGRLVVERARDLAPRRIAVRMQDAVAAVRAFAGECQPGSLAVELRAPVDELPDGSGSFLHQGAHRRAVAEAVSRVQRVPLVQFHLIVVAQSDGDPALRIFGGGFPEAVLGDHQHLARLSQFDGGAQPGHSGSNDEKVRIHRLLRS